MNDISIRVIAGMDEFMAVEALQRVVWGADDREDPADLMMVIQHEGGLVAGAFQAGELVGYVFGFPTRDPKIHHSHRLAVHPRARGAGLALRLKFFQRDWCLSQGINLVRWTFDPLRHTNAHLNAGRLGARVSTYFPDYYGEMKGINAGLPSDRLLAEWHLNDARVALLAGDHQGKAMAPTFPGMAKSVRIHRDMEQLLANNPAEALAERLRVRRELMDFFGRGYEISGYDCNACCYLMVQKDWD